VLARHDGQYRLGAPLAIEWMRRGWVAHFEIRASGSPRMRVDICSRPPRVVDVAEMWRRAVRTADYDVVDVASLIALKQTRRARDYAVIGALAEATGLVGGVADIALSHLRDYGRLRQAVDRWPDEAAACSREAVQLLVAGAARAKVVTALALEQDELVQADDRLQESLWKRAGDFPERFARLRQRWRAEGALLPGQHDDMLRDARSLIEDVDR